MGLDVYLINSYRENTICDHCNSEYNAEVREQLYCANITHNLGRMAGEAGIYQHLWRPEELGITTAQQLIEPLTTGLQLLKDKPNHFEKFNSSNGFGLYEHFVPFVEEYLNACKQYPSALIEISR